MSEGIPSLVLRFATEVIHPETRTETLERFCKDCGLDSLLLFLRDSEVETLLAAPGFPQTYPDGKRWQTFLEGCMEGCVREGTLPAPGSGKEQRAMAVGANGSVLVAMGGNRCGELMRHLKDILPLIGAAFNGERAAMAQRAHAEVAAETAKQAHALAQGLDKARRDTLRELSLRRRAEEQVRKRSRVLEVLNRTGSMLAGELNLEKILQLVTHAGAEIASAEFAAFIRKEGEAPGDRLVAEAVAGDPGRAVGAMLDPANRDLVGPSVLKDEASLVKDLWKDPRFGGRSEGGGLGHLRSFLAVPVSRTGRVFGGLVFGHGEPGVFTADTEDVIISLAAAGAIAIDNAGLHHELQRELEEHKLAEQKLRVAQDELTKANEELETRVQQRTASLKEAVSQMEEFSYSVSHDLRAPLRAINAYADALLEEASERLDETGREYLRRIQRSSVRMEKLTHDVLTYSRVARAELALATIDLEKLIGELASQYVEFQEPNATLEVESPLHRVLAHEVSLGQALTNLVSNSVKFMKRGAHPVIRIWTERVGDLVRIWVEDNGIGIKPSQQARLFTMFERLNPKEGYEGTGIGLAIVRKAVEKMGGQVGVQSDGETGSEFWIELKGAP